ncbi:MAG TPA: enoyl-ACP reductase [Bacillota bacterium]|jgi:enoyl-[acyl-carrier protein] reductase I
MALMAGKKCLIMGVANKRSIAWGIAQALQREGADLAFTYADDRFKENVEELVGGLPGGERVPIYPCDVLKGEEVKTLFEQVGRDWGRLDVLVHSVAYANREDLIGTFTDISWDGYALAHHVSAYSLIEAARHARPLMEAAGGGSIMTMTYLAAEKVVERYNVMATAKSALECNVRYLAAELGPANIRVNAISAGPLKTLAASAVKGLSHLRDVVEERAPLRRNITVEEVGDVGLFLASPLSRCVTGEVIHADNGFNVLGV